MARKPRVEYEGAFYHVIVRGNQRQRIFEEDQDRETYLARVEYYRERYGFRVYAYVLMSNHVHLLLETGKVSLSKILQGIQFTYTQYYNRRYRTVGHLFQGRYKAILCDRDAYLLELVRYIHLNPARLRTPENPWRYRWSSHQAYLGEKTAVGIETEAVLGQLGKSIGQARRAYLVFMNEGKGLGHEERYYQVVDQRFLGDEQFVKKVAEQARQRDIKPSGPEVGFERLIRALAKEHGVEEKVLVEPGRHRRWVKARAQLAYLGREWCGLTAKELGGRLQRDASMVSRLCTVYGANRDEKTEAKLARGLVK